MIFNKYIENYKDREVGDSERRKVLSTELGYYELK